MSTAKNGDTVKLHYTGKLENGELFDQSTEGDPLEFTLGNGSIISGFEKGVVGMEVGATKTITVLPEEGYGPRHEELVHSFTKTWTNKRPKQGHCEPSEAISNTSKLQ